MAVTLDAAGLREALRMGDSPAETAMATRLLAVGTELVIRRAPSAPDAIHTEACVRLAGYINDRPYATRGTAFAQVVINSGAGAVLQPWIRPRAWKAEASD